MGVPESKPEIRYQTVYRGARKRDGSQYEPDTLSCIQNSIGRHIRDLKLTFSLKTDVCFSHSRRVLEAKRKALKSMGKGAKPNKAAPLTKEEINILYQEGVLGIENPEQLLNTIWLNNGVNFGLRGRQDHTNLHWGDVQLKMTSDGKEYLEFNDRPPPPKPKLVPCWRPMPWDDRDALRDELLQYSTGKSNVPVANIALFGLAGSGKSSLFNTLDSIFKNKISSRSEAGEAIHSLTRKFSMYYPGSVDKKLKFRLCDSMGMEEDQGLGVEDLPYILDGNIPDNFEFKLDERITPDSKGFKPNPSPADRMHCICYLVDVKKEALRSKETLAKIGKLKALARSRGIRFVILFTKIDELCPDVCKDTRKAYESANLDEIVKKISVISGTPISYIFLVRNYHQEQDLNYDIDVLILRTFKQILGYVDDVLQDMGGAANEMVPCWREMPWEESQRNEVFTELSKYSTEKESVPLANIVLLGSIGSGKSSFINTVDSIFKEKLSSRAEVRSDPDCVTKQFRMYRPGGKNTKVNFRLIDTMGMNEDNGLNLTALPLILDGNVPEKFKFSSGECLTSESPGLNMNQSLADRMHCVCYVMDANSITKNKEAVVKMMKHIMSLASSRDIRVVVLITKIDEFCPALTLDISKAYDSKVLEEAVKEISSLSGLLENLIFLIKNFTTDQDLKTKADVLVLGALQRILGIVDDFLEDND